MYISHRVYKECWCFWPLRQKGGASSNATHILSVSCEVSELHHLVAKLAENLYKFLEGADSFQMVKGYQDLNVRRSERAGGFVLF